MQPVQDLLNRIRWDEVFAAVSNRLEEKVLCFGGTSRLQ